MKQGWKRAGAAMKQNSAFISRAGGKSFVEQGINQLMRPGQVSESNFVGQSYDSVNAR